MQAWLCMPGHSGQYLRTTTVYDNCWLHFRVVSACLSELLSGSFIFEQQLFGSFFGQLFGPARSSARQSVRNVCWRMISQGACIPRHWIFLLLFSQISAAKWANFLGHSAELSGSAVSSAEWVFV